MNRGQQPDPPQGFTVHGRTSGFLDLIGPLYSRGEAEALQLALRIDERHLNSRGTVHGGVLCGLADVALGYATAGTETPPAPLSTASLTVDFAGAARCGDVVVSSVDVQRVGRRLAYANCYLSVGDRRIVRASAVFARAQER